MKSLLEERLHQLNWSHTASQLDDLVENASTHNVSYFDFLHTVVSGEWEHRESTELNRRIHRAKLPYTKTIHDFDLAFQPSLNEQRINETLTCRYIANGENRLLLGPPAVGKTHLAIAFALEALTQGYSVLFLTAADLVAECHKAEAKGTVSRLIKK